MNTPRSIRLTLRRKILFSCTTFLFFLLLLEGLARLLEPSRDEGRLEFRQLFVRDREMLWRLRPHADFLGLICNAQGFRDDDFILDTPSHTIRIAAVGDSCTFGGDYHPAADYPAQMEAALNRMATGNTRFQVYNFSGHGYSSFQGRILFETEVVRYQPNVAVVYFGLNDYVYSSHLSDASAPLLPGWFVSLDNLLWYTAAYRMLMSRGNEWAPQRLPQGVDANNLRQSLPRRVSPDEFAENLSAIARTAKRNGIVPVFLDFRVRPEIPLMLNQIPVYDATAGMVRWFQPRAGAAGEAIARGQLDGVDAQSLAADLASCPDYAAGYYARAWLAENAGKIADASADYARAAQLDYDRRLIEEYRAALRRVGEKYDVPVLSADNWIPPGRAAWPYFYDERHLTAEGDRLLGEALAKDLRRRYKW